MDKEKNVFDIQNEDGLLKVDEENKLQLGEDVFREDEERFLSSEENEHASEENVLKTSSNSVKKENQKNDTVKSANSLRAGLSLPGLVVALVGAIAVIGTSTGLIKISNSNHVINFLSRSTELGFEIDKNSGDAFVMTLSRGDYVVSEELTFRNQFIFSDLIPNTVYDLTVYDISNNNSKKIYSSNYLTKSHDDYYASINNNQIVDDMLSFDVTYEGNNISYVTVEVLGDNLNSLYIYEGSPKEQFTVNVATISDITCRVSINGKMTHFEQLKNPDEIEPEPPVEENNVLIYRASAPLDNYYYCVEVDYKEEVPSYNSYAIGFKPENGTSYVLFEYDTTKMGKQILKDIHDDDLTVDNYEFAFIGLDESSNETVIFTDSVSKSDIQNTEYDPNIMTLYLHNTLVDYKDTFSCFFSYNEELYGAITNRLKVTARSLSESDPFMTDYITAINEEVQLTEWDLNGYSNGGKYEVVISEVFESTGDEAIIWREEVRFKYIPKS